MLACQDVVAQCSLFLSYGMYIKDDVLEYIQLTKSILYTTSNYITKLGDESLPKIDVLWCKRIVSVTFVF